MNIKRTLFFILLICAFNDVAISDKSPHGRDTSFTKFKAILEIVNKTIDITSTFIDAAYSGKLAEGELKQKYERMMINMSDILNKINDVPQLRSRGFGTVDYQDEYMSRLTNDFTNVIEAINIQFRNFLHLCSFSNYTAANTYMSKDFADRILYGKSRITSLLDELHLIFVGRTLFLPSNGYLEILAERLTVSFFDNRS